MISLRVFLALLVFAAACSSPSPSARSEGVMKVVAEARGIT